MHTRTLSTLAVLALSAGLLTSCGGSGSDAYCSELKSDKTYFDSIGTGNDPAKIDKAFEKFHSLAKKAPDAVADDWKVLDDAITTVQKALKDAGVTFADLAKAEGGQAPKGVDPQKLAAHRAQAAGPLGSQVRQGEQGHQEARQGHLPRDPRRQLSSLGPVPDRPSYARPATQPRAPTGGASRSRRSLARVRRRQRQTWTRPTAHRTYCRLIAHRNAEAG